MAAEEKLGTHAGVQRRPACGWADNTKPEARAGRGRRRARKNLAARIKDWEALPASYKNGAYHKPGSTQVK